MLEVFYRFSSTNMNNKRKGVVTDECQIVGDYVD